MTSKENSKNIDIVTFMSGAYQSSDLKIIETIFTKLTYLLKVQLCTR